MCLQVAERSTIGKRQTNEDTAVSAHVGIGGNDLVLLGVFDGVGGHADGRTASRIAAETLLAQGPDIAGLLGSGIPDESNALAQADVKETASKWQQSSVHWLQEAVGVEGKNPDMATTCVAAAMSGDILIGWWLGDSRAYLFRDGRLQQLTTDHSTVVELGLSDEEAFDHPKRAEITRFLRASSTFEPETFVEEWRDGDVVLLVSDGVSGSLRGWELETFLAYWLISDISAEMLATRLLEHIAPNQSDNASVAVAIRGTPRPLGNAFPQVPLPALVGFGLTEYVLNTLVSYPANSAEWDLRHTPPWRTLPASTPLLNSQQHQTDENAGGAFVEVIAPGGARTSFGPVVSLTLAARDGALSDVSDAEISGPVAIRIDHDTQLLRINTPLGAHLETQVIEVLDLLQGPPLTFTVEDHIVIVASSERNSLDTLIRIQRRSPDDDIEDVIADTEEMGQDRAVAQPPRSDAASDEPAVPDPTA